MTVLTGRLRRAVGSRGDEGASSIEMVLYTPLLMLIIFVTVQFALNWHGSSVAGAVAREAARTVRVGGGTPVAIAEAEVRGLEYADAIGGAALRDVTVDVVPLPGDRIQVTVRGRANEIVDGLAPTVKATVEGPVEVFRPDT